MADWYVSSVAYAAVAQFAVSTAYSVGALRRQLAAPAVGSERVFRCTTAGTSGGSEPSWNLTKGATTNTGTAVFTEVTGNSAYGWSAASARLDLINDGHAASGDRIFLSSDHAETQASAITLSSVNLLYLFSVNRAGSVPPVAADLLPGASIATTGAFSIALGVTSLVYWEGITLSAGSGASTADISLNQHSGFFKNCAFILNSTSAACNVVLGSSSHRTVWDNCSVTFGNAAQFLDCNAGTTFEWRNTATPILGTAPTILFNSPANARFWLHGLDLSSFAGTFFGGTWTSLVDARIENCRLNAAATLGVPTSSNRAAKLELFNCDDGTANYRHELSRREGSASADSDIVRSGGASNGTTPFSHRYETTASAVNELNDPFEGIALYIWNETTGTPVTATVETIGHFIYDAELFAIFEYLGSASYPLGTQVRTAPATGLTADTEIAELGTENRWPAAGCWNAADVSVSQTLSNDDFTCAKTAGNGGGARSLVPALTGLRYFELTIDALGGSPNTAQRIGFSNDVLGPNSTLGATSASVGYDPHTGAVSFNGGTVGTAQTATAGDVMCFAVNFTTLKVWVRKNGGDWNNAVIGSQNPATGTGGFSFAGIAAGPYYVGFSVVAINDTGTVTINTGPTFDYTKPSGFSDWVTSRKLTATFTPQMKGLVSARILAATPSELFYVDPVITLS